MKQGEPAECSSSLQVESVVSGFEKREGNGSLGKQNGAWNETKPGDHAEGKASTLPRQKSRRTEGFSCVVSMKTSLNGDTNTARVVY